MNDAQGPEPTHPVDPNATADPPAFAERSSPPVPSTNQAAANASSDREQSQAISQLHRLSSLLMRWDEQREQGRSVSIEDLCRECPELLEPLRQRIEDLRAINRFLVRSGDGKPKAADPYPTLAPSETPDVSPSAPYPAVPGYEILGELGRGGMGIVYQARHTKLQRLVALKMMKGGAEVSADDLQRFRTEAEAVARLQHPNVVQIHEVGDWEGLPFITLEYCAGGNLARKMDGTPLPPREAAQLTETLAGAIAAAHQKQIIHRDLKPHNVLLTEDGVPKITDFGLAKKLDAGKQQTHKGAIVGTPSYMAPEQAVGEPQAVGPLADVYALGAVLYECLTGRPPFNAATTLDTILQVLQVEPVSPRRLQPKVHVDLETICLKCLAKEPARRYAGARELADDLGRFLAGETIRARPVGKLKRAAKWARRRPALAALLGVSLLTVLGVSAGVVWHNAQLRVERDRAEHNFHRARKVVDDMLTAVAEEKLAIEPGMQKTQRALLEKALHYHKEFLQERGDDPEVRKEAALAYHRVADIQRLLENNDAAQQAYEQAIALLSHLAKNYPDEGTYRHKLAESYNWLGELHRLGARMDEAGASYREALRLQAQLVREFPREPDFEKDVARSHYNLGILYKDTGQLAEADTALQQARRLLEDLHGKHPQKASYQQELARSLLNRALVLGQRNEHEQAVADTRTAVKFLDGLLARRRELPARQPEYCFEVGVCHNNLGLFLVALGRHREAGAHLDTARALFQKLEENFQDVPKYRRKLAHSYNLLGNARSGLKDLKGAEEAWQQAHRLFAQLVKEVGDSGDYLGLGMLEGNFGWLRTEQRQLHEAVPHYARAIANVRVALRPNPRNQEYQRVLFNQYRNLAETLVELMEHEKASEAALALADVQSNPAEGCYFAACFLARCARVVQGDSGGSHPEHAALARRYSADALRLLNKAIDQGYPQVNLDAPFFEALQPLDAFQALRSRLKKKKAP
jgi:serine/threonine-protein kinase